MTRIAVMAIALLLAGCGVVPVANEAPVPAGPLGPIVQSPDGGPPIECRGVPIAECQTFGDLDDADVVRYIVTCTTVCTPQNGDVRIDILGINGQVRTSGGGSYSSAVAEPEPVITPPPSDPGPS